MKTIFKYEVLVKSVQELTLPVNSEMLCLEAQDGKLFLWAKIDREEKRFETIILRAYATGDTFDDTDCEYINTMTLVSSFGNVVLHFFKKVG